MSKFLFAIVNEYRYKEVKILKITTKENIQIYIETKQILIYLYGMLVKVRCVYGTYD